MHFQKTKGQRFWVDNLPYVDRRRKRLQEPNRKTSFGTRLSSSPLLDKGTENRQDVMAPVSTRNGGAWARCSTRHYDCIDWLLYCMVRAIGVRIVADLVFYRKLPSRGSTDGEKRLTMVSDFRIRWGFMVYDHVYETIY